MNLELCMARTNGAKLFRDGQFLAHSIACDIKQSIMISRKKNPSLRIVKNLIFEKKIFHMLLPLISDIPILHTGMLHVLFPAPFQNHLEINHNACKENQESFLGVICI